METQGAKDNRIPGDVWKNVHYTDEVLGESAGFMDIKHTTSLPLPQNSEDTFSSYSNEG